MEYKEVYESWLANPYFDEATKQELLSIKDDENEIKERFYADLEFGTAGLRGIIGAGTNRMNVYVVRKTTQGLANYISKQNAADKGVAIAFDSRRMSTEFANEAALCLAANGIKAYIFDALRPTPELSFAVRHLGCTAGINITASHNPPEYNGYKVYWADGAQITPPHDSGIMAEVKAVTDYNEVKTMNRDQAIAAGLYQVIGSDVDDVYIAQLKKQVKNPELIKEAKASDMHFAVVPTNSYYLRTLSDEEWAIKHPVRKMVELGLKVFPNSDDPTMHHISISESWLLMHNWLDFTLPQLRKMLENSIEAAWVTDEQKAIWKKEWLKEFDRLSVDLPPVN